MMAKDKPLAIRSHLEEREWLLSLGKGNLIDGVRSLIQLTREGSIGSNGLVRPKRKRLKQLNR